PAAVNLYRCSSDVARALGSEERDHCRQLTRLAETAHRDLLPPPPSELARADSLLLCHHLSKLIQTLRARVTRQDVVDRDSISRDFVRERARKAGQSCPQAV